MHNSVWKLTSLATVAGVALFFIVQAQKLINPQGKNSQANVIGEESFPEDSDRHNSDQEHSREELSDNDTPNGPNDIIEPDPFADEDSSERKATSAKYRNAREEALHGTDDADHSANRKGLQTRTASRRQPHLRLPKGEKENPFQESDESIAEEAVKVGPRLSLPEKLVRFASMTILRQGLNRRNRHRTFAEHQRQRFQVWRKTPVPHSPGVKRTTAIFEPDDLARNPLLTPMTIHPVHPS